MPAILLSATNGSELQGSADGVLYRRIAAVWSARELPGGIELICDPGIKPAAKSLVSTGNSFRLVLPDKTGTFTFLGRVYSESVERQSDDRPAWVLKMKVHEPIAFDKPIG
jgi:hypothetical protein